MARYATRGEAIKDLRKLARLSQEELASQLNTTKQTIYKYENGIVTNIPSDKIEAMAKIFKVSPAVIMGWDENPAPIYSAAAGEGLICDVPVDEINMSLDDDETLAYVVGRSMEPTLMDGDIVVVKVQPVPDNKRQICLVKVNGEENTFKRVDVKENGITLIADNLDVYAPHFYTAEEVEDLPVRIMGVVTRLIRKVK